MFTYGPRQTSAPAPATDPFWGDVLFLLNGQQTLTTDSGPLNKALSTSGTPTLDAGVMLFGYPTYLIDLGVAERIYLTAGDAYIVSACTDVEWCFEFWIRPTGANSDERFCSFGSWDASWSSDGSLAAHVVLNSTTYSATTATGVVPADTWSHVAFVRDKTDGTFDYLKLYVNGVLKATSAAISKSYTVYPGASLGWLLGFNAFGAAGYFSNERFTANHARYYSDFTPPTAPFPTS
jgi:hypothetical protein